MRVPGWAGTAMLAHGVSENMMIDSILAKFFIKKYIFATKIDKIWQRAKGDMLKWHFPTEKIFALALFFVLLRVVRILTHVVNSCEAKR